MLAQQDSGTDARELQELRRVDRAAAENDLAARLGDLLDPMLEIFNADRALAFEQHPRRQGSRLDAEVGALHRRMQIGHRRRTSLTVLHSQLVVADTFLLLCIDVWVSRDAGLDAGLDHGVRHFMICCHVRDVERPANGVMLARSAFLVFGLEEVGPHIVPAPALAAELAPAVVIGVLAADVEQAVDRGRAAENLAARPHMHSSARARVRLGRIQPVNLWILEGSRIPHRHVDHEVRHELRKVLGWPVIPSGFQQQHLVHRVRR